MDEKASGEREQDEDGQNEEWSKQLDEITWNI
jgi:hypothetical protein